jgi:hypothetical protein
MSSLPVSLQFLMKPETIRARCHDILKLAQNNQLRTFTFDPQKWDLVVSATAQETKQNYPDLKVPIHGRLRHFEVGGINRVAHLREQLPKQKEAMAAALIDMVMVSVLLDAGSGPRWKYRESSSAKIFTRSEGLAVASYDMFTSGIFSHQKSKPLQVHGQKLSALSLDDLSEGMQASETNPLSGLEGRLALLQRLGSTLQKNSTLWGTDARPGNIVQYILENYGRSIRSDELFEIVLLGLHDIWPSRFEIDGYSLGDCWHHPQLEGNTSSDAAVPFHKLTQWLTYSLVEPLQLAGIKIGDLDLMTGLAEYRNGGLFVDYGVIIPKSSDALRVEHDVGSELIVSWRALTVALLDLLAISVRQQLNLSPEQFPIASLLQGGSWSAGRKIASQKRPDGSPPIRIKSDGTVF